MLILNDIIKHNVLIHANEQYKLGRESCGVLFRDDTTIKYARCRNLAKEGDHFILHPLDYAYIEDSYDIISIVHSHINESPEPSEQDLKEAYKTKLPWHIVSVPSGEFYSFKPDSHYVSLLGREFSHGYLDCFSLCRDYYNYKLGIILDDIPRDDDKWWECGNDLLVDNFKNFGFNQVYDIKKHDVILMNIQCDISNHLAVYCGDEKIIHHLGGKLSRHDPYGGYWQKQTFMLIRHNTL